MSLVQMPLPKKTHKLLLKNQNACLIEVKIQRSRPKPSAANDNPEQKKRTQSKKRESSGANENTCAAKGIDEAARNEIF